MRTFGCPTCGSKDNRVRQTGHDEDGYKVRLRVCVCGTKWATEEVPIALSAFYPRIQNMEWRRLARLKRSQQWKTCAYCPQDYRVGSFRQHVQFSKVHDASLTPAWGSRRNRRRLQREYIRRKAAA